MGLKQLGLKQLKLVIRQPKLVRNKLELVIGLLKLELVMEYRKLELKQLVKEHIKLELKLEHTKLDMVKHSW